MINISDNYFFWPILPEKKISEKITLQEIHIDNLMVTRILMKKGAEIPLHSHENEQITVVLKGKLRFTLDNTEKILRLGEGVKIPQNTLHSAIAEEDCECLDSWYPIRKDYIIKE